VLEPPEVASQWYGQVYLAALDSSGRRALLPLRRRAASLPDRSRATLEDVARDVLASDERAPRSRLRRLLAL